MDVMWGVNGSSRDSAAGRWRQGLTLIAFGLLLFGWRLGGHDLWPPDEPRFGVVAREMRASGNLVTLSLNGDLYTDKPPLFFWAINAFGLLVGGVNEWACRLPSLLSALAALLLIACLGRDLYDRRTGLVAAVVFATSLQILERARWASIDMTLNALVLAAILLLWRGALAGAAGRWQVRGAWCLMGLATLAKGPVGIVLPLLATLPALVLLRDAHAARRVLSPSGMLLCLLVILAWFAPFALRVGPPEAWAIMTRQTVHRYVDAWNARHPFWYYLWRFPAGFFPWVVFLPWALKDALSRARTDRERRASLFLTAWIAAIFLFFSLSTGKRGVYIIPLYPAAALLVARLFCRDEVAAGRSGVETRRAVDEAAASRVRQAVAAWAAVAVVVAVAAVLLVPRRHPGLGLAAACAALALVAGAVAAWMTARRGRPVGAALSVAAAMTALLLVGTESVMPWANRYLNLSGFARQAGLLLRDDVPLAATREKRDAWVFYTGRQLSAVDSQEEVLDYLSQPPPRDLLIEEEFLAALRDRLPSDVREIVQSQVSATPFYLLRRGGGR